MSIAAAVNQPSTGQRPGRYLATRRFRNIRKRRARSCVQSTEVLRASG